MNTYEPIKIKLYTHKLKVGIDDDIEATKRFLTRKIKETASKDISFSFDVEETDYKMVDVPNKLMKPLDGKYDIVAYAFDRYTADFHSSIAFDISPTLRGMYIQTSVHDDGVNSTWMSIAHEIVHCFFYKLKSLGIVLTDPMDVMWVKGVAYPYKENWNPDSKTGNFHYAFQLLAQYWDKIATISVQNAPIAVKTPTMPQVKSSMPTVVITRSKDQTRQTMGKLVAKNGGATFSCDTLELPWLNNEKSISCISTGTYIVKWIYSWGRMKWIYQLEKVPNRTFIQIHAGNYASGKKKDIEGCILLGKGFTDLNGDKSLDIINSTSTIKLFESFMQNKTFTLTIK